MDTKDKYSSKPYKDWSKDEKTKFFDKHYVDELLPLSKLAELTDTYVNRMRRDLMSLGYEIRNKSDAAKVALKQGRMFNPTEGQKLSEETKDKIGKSRSEAWYNLSDEEKQSISEEAKKRFENWDGREAFLRKGTKAVANAAQKGSKLERFLKEKLEEAGYVVECHGEQLVGNDSMHIDLFIPEGMLAIEVDGPSHHHPIYGEEKLIKTQEADKRKNDKILGAGFRLIRVKQTKNLTRRTKDHLACELIKHIDGTDKYLEIGDENV
jgi:very-short-patch-repair endonuclease